MSMSRIFKVIGLPLLSLIFPLSVFAASVELRWRANTEPDLSSYNIYYGNASRSYSNPIPVGKVTSHTIDGLVKGQTYYFALTAMDTSGNESGFSNEVSKKAVEAQADLPKDPAKDPIALWLMDEGQGTNLTDASGNGNTGKLAHNGTSSNPAWQTDASQGKVIALNGAGWNNASAGNYIDLGSLDVSGNQLSIGVMFKASSLDPYDGRLISKQAGRQEQDHYWMLSRFSNNSLRFRLRTNGSVSTLISSANVFQKNEWVLAVATYDGSQMKIYCNGQLVGSMPKSGAIDTNSSIHAFIGVGQDGSKLLTTLDGQVAHAFVYNRALTLEEVKPRNVSNTSSQPDSVNLTTSLNSPQNEGTIVRFTASASGGSGSYEYKFWEIGPATGNKWKLIRDYSTSNSINWDSTGKAGQNNIVVWVRSAGTSIDEWDAQRATGTGFTIQNSPKPQPSSVTLTTSLNSPQNEGTIVRFTASASGGSGSYEYKFWEIGPATNNKWKIIRDYSTSNSLNWDSTGKAGQNNIVVWVRSAGTSIDKWDPQRGKGTSFSIQNAPTQQPTSVSLSKSLNSPQNEGTVIRFTASASGGSGSYEYKFWEIGPATNNKWKIIRDYSTSNSLNWDSTGKAGQNNIVVWVRSAGTSIDKWDPQRGKGTSFLVY